jgi:uncharacterized membrane protein (DUF485 family)
VSIAPSGSVWRARASRSGSHAGPRASLRPGVRTARAAGPDAVAVAGAGPDREGAVAVAGAGPDREGDVYRRVQESPEFRELRRGYRGLAFPLTAAFLAWYLCCLLLSTFSPGLMAHRVAGYVNVALLLGLGQFLTTFLACLLVARASAAGRDARARELRWRAQEELR